MKKMNKIILEIEIQIENLKIELEKKEKNCSELTYSTEFLKEENKTLKDTQKRIGKYQKQ
jgi:hypothetical protein